MAVSPALTGGELTALLGVGTVRRFLSPVPDVTVATALVNQVTFTYPIAQLTVDTTSNWTLVREGMTVYVGSGAGLRDRGTYRVRKAGNSTTLYIEEIGSQSPGQLAIDIRTAGIANNDFITVIQRYDMWSVLPRINATTGLITEDFDLAVSTRTTTPEALTYITVNGIRNHLFTYITTSTLAITAAVTVTKWPTSSGSTLTYLWVYPAGWTGVSGSTTATLTATATPGNYSLRCTVTDSIGGATERIIVVNIHDDTTNPPLLISEMPRSDTRDRTGRRMSFPLYNNRLASLVDGAMCGYFEVCTWNSTDVGTASRQFVGWIQRHDFSTADTLREATIELVGPAALLDKMQIVSNVASAATVADTWQKVVPSLASGAFMAWLLLRWRAANTLRLFNFTPFSVTATGQRLPRWQIDKGSALSQIRQIITERGNFGANSEGELLFLYHPSLIDYASRSSVVVRDSLDASIYKSLTGIRDLPPRVQQVRGEGLSWDGSAVLPTPYYSDAPKSPGQGSTQTKLGSQIVTGQSELNQLTGDEYARANNPYSQLSVLIEKNRDVYEPAEMAFVNVALASSLNPTGAALSKRTIPISVSKHHNPDLTSDIELVVEAETHGLPGDYVPVPPPNDDNFGNGATPPPIDILPLPPLGDISFPFPGGVFPTIPSGGGIVVVPGKAGIRVDRTNNKVYWSADYTIASPVETDVTPSGFTHINHATLDKGGPWPTKIRGAYVVGDDGTNSWVVYTPDIFQTTPTYTAGATVTGAFEIVESVKDIPGAVYIYGQAGAVLNPADDWNVMDASHGVITARDDTSITIQAQLVGGNYYAIVDSSGINSCALVTLVTVISGVSPSLTSWTDCGQPQVLGVPEFSGLFGYGSYCVNYFQMQDALPFTIKIFFAGDAGCGTAVTTWESVYSTDYGVTMGTPRLVDTLAGTPGFSVGPRGIAALAGGLARVRTALAGGTYANTVNGSVTASYPISIKVPDYKIGSVSATNKADAPDFLFQSPDLVGGEAAWRTTLAGKVAITPTVGGNKYLGVSPFGAGMWRGKRAILIAEYSGTRYIFTTKNVGVTPPVWSRTSHTNAVSVRPVLHSSTGMQWIAACGADGMLYSQTAGVSWSVITVTGVASYAELLG